MKAKIWLPPKLISVFEGEARYRGAYGGRGSGKTRSFAKMTAVRGYMFAAAGITGQILCAREHLNSLDESSLAEIKQCIQEEPWLDEFYECGERYIRSRCGSIQYTFAGLRHNIESVKSKSRILICWIDEAEPVSERAWQVLIPSVREHNSEIWVTWNPESPESATHNRFRKTQPDDSKIAEINWADNPKFPAVLERERLEDKTKRLDVYDHIWEGAFLEVIEGAYYKDQLRKANEDGRIGKLIIADNQPCMTFWDIGNTDGTAIWVVQRVGEEYRCIDFYEAWGEPYSHAVKWLQSLGYLWDAMYLPHDAGHKRQGATDNKSPQEMLKELMPSIDWVIVPRIPELIWGIQQVRDVFHLLWFDDRCEKGVSHVRKYRRKWSENEKRWLNTHDKSEGHSEAADALRQLAQAHAGGLLTTQRGWGEPLKRRLKGIV